MDSVGVHKMLHEVSTKVVLVTRHSDADQMVNLCSDTAQILQLLSSSEHDVIAEQMLEQFWRFALRWYFFEYDSGHEPFQSSVDELYQRAGMLAVVLELYGDAYGKGLESEARAICIALKKGCRDFLKIAGKIEPPAKASSPKKPSRGIRLVVSN